MNPAIKFVHEALNPNTQKTYPIFKAGDHISVSYKITEGGKERIQVFKGDVIKNQGSGFSRSFTVRKMSNLVGVERTFPLNTPHIESIVVHKVGKVRRSKLYYMRKRSGKRARIDEKIVLQDIPAKD